jgi:predicted phosphoribosyltransferase
MMAAEFRDRIDAGERLAARLTEYATRTDVLVLALPRGGVPVGAVVAEALRAPLDVFVVRKLGLPGYPELAIGAIASGVRVLNSEILHSLRFPRGIIEEVCAREAEELARRERAYRDGRPPPAVEGRSVILVDDGIATGSTMLAAINALRELHAREIVAATPVIAAPTCGKITSAADKLVAVIVPEEGEFYGVGRFYEDFSQTSDDEVRELLAATDAPPSDRNGNNRPAG